jgi:hypothetical protein
MNRTRYSALITGILIVLFASAAGLAQSGASPLGIVPTPTPTTPTVTISTDKTSYALGQYVTITYTISQAAYVYVLDIQPDGIVRQVFPNQYSAANYVGAGTHMLPDNSSYRFTVSPPTGTEQLQIIASGVPLYFASSYTEPFPMVGSTPSAAAMGIQAQIKGITPEPQWATAWTSFQITTYSYTPTPPSGGYYYYPPFMGFPGGTWYWNGAQWVYGLPPSGFYWYFGTDGQWHLRITFHFGSGS